MKTSQKKQEKSSTITLERLYRARYYCAYFMSKDKVSRVKLLPIFERLEQEIANKEKETSLIDKAMKIANDNNRFWDTNCDT